MPHTINRVLRAFASRAWFIDGGRAQEIVSLLETRALDGPRAAPYREEPVQDQPIAEERETIAVLNLQGPIVPRSSGIHDISGPTVASMERFAVAFDKAAMDDKVTGIILNVDSPGGSIDLVPETAERIRKARKPGRPIIAIANTMAASAAYWIASAADELVVTPSGQVGSIGAYILHEEISGMLEASGVKMTFISEGPRKTEGSPFEPLGQEAAAALQENVRVYYDQFVADVSRHRGVRASVVRADPVKSENHMGGGRVYPAKTAVKLGMADRVETLEQVVQRLQRGGRGRQRGGKAEAITFSVHSSGNERRIITDHDWPELSAISDDMLTDPNFEGAVADGVFTIRVDNGWARYALDETVDANGIIELAVISSHWEPPNEAQRPSINIETARKRLALI